MISNIWVTERGRTFRSYLVYLGFTEHVFNEFSFLSKIKWFSYPKFFQNIKILKGRFGYS